MNDHQREIRRLLRQQGHYPDRHETIMMRRFILALIVIFAVVWVLMVTVLSPSRIPGCTVRLHVDHTWSVAGDTRENSSARGCTVIVENANG